uniref:Probable magnesium-protoporphyrin IX monomethyl ester [oxidative] cyclase n=1 Tax=Hildenbrandia rivularis TaxID=135206 RepID=A0A1C9CFD9_9FLOR|nr:Magnesium-protoporphyrin IX monomethyl ester oxidative cyclase [Hildenbrandia rivularis]AOM67074.1 Magnesium-protoporphyrin IX monomethyl ester oxidative cyclase [Hildenbrandia rivularis]
MLETFNIIMKINNINQQSKETLLTPRFYTTNFEEMSKLDISNNQEEFEALLQEFRADYNQQHFIRKTAFNNSQALINKSAKSLFVEFLERSCTAEFSGFLLYKELSRRLKNTNPILAECFLLMSRDEARHAGFLNKAMNDFNVSLDLGLLTKHRKYTFFAPKFIFYATYLSEKIGYWRYITIYRHLEQYPEYRIYPIFRFFESWCQDENRHGDFFAALLKSQPNLLNSWQSKLWCRFFLVSVFITMYLNDCQRSNFYSAIGLDSRQYDMQVIRKTNESASRVFPVALNVDHPKFFQYLDLCASTNRLLINIQHSNYPLKIIYKISLYLKIAWLCFKLYMIHPVNSKGIWETIK